MNIEIEKQRKVYLSALNANEDVALPASMFGGWLLAKSVVDRQLKVALDALRFYAEGHHFALADPDAWDTVSGEPQNFQCDEAGTATVEDGTMAKMALQELAGENTAYSDMIAADEEDMQAAIGATPPIPVGLFESAAQAVSDGRHEDAGNFLSTAIRLTAPAPGEVDTARIDWLDAQDHLHALQWRANDLGAPVKTSLYDRNRIMIGEGISLRHAVDAAMQKNTRTVKS